MSRSGIACWWHAAGGRISSSNPNTMRARAMKLPRHGSSNPDKMQAVQQYKRTHKVPVEVPQLAVPLKQARDAVHKADSCATAEDADGADEGPDELIARVAVRVRLRRLPLRLHDADAQQHLSSGRG